MAMSDRTSAWRFATPPHITELVMARHQARRRLLEAGFSRRNFLRAAGSVPGMLLLATRRSTAAAAGCDPAPIAEELILAPGLPGVHVQLPGVVTPANTDPSTITDFNGHVGFAIVDGTGLRTDLNTGAQAIMPFEVDLRFMEGEFIGTDGRHCHGAFALI
jgi:hypothetical protein